MKTKTTITIAVDFETKEYLREHKGQLNVSDICNKVLIREIKKHKKEKNLD